MHATTTGNLIGALPQIRGTDSKAVRECFGKKRADRMDKFLISSLMPLMSTRMTHREDTDTRFRLNVYATVPTGAMLLAKSW